MGKSIQLKSITNEKIYPHPYYPVGAIYLSVDNTNPTKWFGGTWSLIAQGRTLVGVDTNDTDFNTVKKTGGSKTVSYTPRGSNTAVALTVEQIPAHTHSYKLAWGNNDPCNGFNYATNVAGTFTNENQLCKTGGGKTHNHTFTGTADTINKVQPYYTCYIWCRTA